jgi:hypothetical protein
LCIARHELRNAPAIPSHLGTACIGEQEKENVRERECPLVSFLTHFLVTDTVVGICANFFMVFIIDIVVVVVAIGIVIANEGTKEVE